jgi:hypothetical protein
MPIEPVTASLIATGVAAAGQGVNAIAQGNMNKKTRAWNEMMYEKQKSDNMKLWDLQNQYNSPTSQMQRLQEAGLNPNLVYGSGGGSFTSPTPKSADVQNWSPQSVKIDTGSMLSAYNDFRLRDAQIKNVEANTLKTMTEANLAKDTYQFSYDAKRLQSASMAQKWGLGPRTTDNTSEYFLKQLKAQTLEALQKQADTAKTNMQKNLYQEMVNKLQQDIKIQQPELQMIEKIGAGNSQAGMAMQLLRLLLKR